MPKTFEDKLTHVQEECSEVIDVCSQIIKDICKIKRFGLDNKAPNEEHWTNKTSLLYHIKELKIYELKDLLQVFDIIEKELESKLKPEPKPTEPVGWQTYSHNWNSYKHVSYNIIFNKDHHIPNEPIKELTRLKPCNACDQIDNCLNNGICHYTESDLSEIEINKESNPSGYR